MELCRTGSAPQDGKLFPATALAAKRVDEFAVIRKDRRAQSGDLAAIIPVYHPLDIYCISNKVHGYEPNDMTLYPRMNDVWMEG